MEFTHDELEELQYLVANEILDIEERLLYVDNNDSVIGYYKVRLKFLEQLNAKLRQ